jgi:hypothetical protein
MAFYILNIKHFPFPKFLSLFDLLMITNFFSVTSVNFNLSNFSSESDVSLDRAFVEDQEIKLTGNEKQVKTNFVGRATYSSPMHLVRELSPDNSLHVIKNSNVLSNEDKDSISCDKPFVI